MKKAFLFLIWGLMVSCTNQKKAKPYEWIFLPQYDEIGDFSRNRAPVKKEGKYGFIDTTGKLVIPLQYEQTYGFSNNYRAEVKKDGKWGMIDTTGKAVVSLKFENNVSHFSDGLIDSQRNGKWGVTDTSGKIVIPFEYDYVGTTANGFFWEVRKGGHQGLMDTTGKEIFPAEFEYIYYDYERKWFFVQKVQKKSYLSKEAVIDITGKFVISYNNDVEFFREEGLFKITKVFGTDLQTRWLYGFADTTGKMVIPMQYEYVQVQRKFSSNGQFYEGLLDVQKNGKRGFIDKTGKMVISPMYDFVHHFSKGLAAVSKDGKSGFIDKTGKVVIPLKYQETYPFEKEGLAQVKLNDKYGFIDTTGKVVIPLKFDYFLEASLNTGGSIGTNGFSIRSDAYPEKIFSEEGLIGVANNDKWGFVDKNGQVVIPLQYDEVKAFDKGWAKVKKEGKWFFVNAQGKTTNFRQTNENRILDWTLVEKNNKYGLADSTGKLVVPILYDNIRHVDKNWFIVTKEGKCGVMNKAWEILVPIKYERIEYFYGQKVFAVKEKGKWGLLECLN